MKKLKILFPLLTLWVAMAWSQMTESGLGRQPGEMPRNPYGRELVNYRFYSFADSVDHRQNSVEFYFAMVNDLLTFIKRSEVCYQAKYELSVMVYNKKHELVAYQNLSDTISVASFNATNSRQQPVLKRMVFTLPPEEYEFRIELTNSDNPADAGRPVMLKLVDFSKPSLQISDLVLTDRQSCDGALRRFAPNLRESFSEEQSDMGVYFELYGSRPSDSIMVHYALVGRDNKIVGEKKYQLAGGPLLAQCLALREMIVKPGEYMFRLEASTGKVLVKAERRLFVHWGRVAIRSDNVDAAVEQLAMITSGKQIQKMKSAAPEERQQLFDQFWQQRDPTPGTPENELRVEFFNRIDYANRNFSEPTSSTDGWKTDRGRVLLRNGAPDDVERQAVEPGMPTVEIWQYTRLNKRYIFVDQQGMGEFRLVKVE
jgi:GWxTD domain-containing protein